ncbi:tetratricopeptide repeat protein [Candidatus Acetothermia bacterium]|nr:tetratricopeptide repeat protein [Candidatus Acetothermia bacterium]
MNAESNRELKIQCFGKFEVCRDGVPISASAWGRIKTQTLLKVLLISRGQVFTQDQLIEALFSDLDPQKAVRNLHARLSELRRVLEPNLSKGTDSRFILNVGQQGYCFSKEVSCWVDTEEFEKLFKLAQEAEQAGQWPQALDDYQETNSLYQGKYLAEDRDEKWASTTREHWNELYLISLGRLAECYARLGQYNQAIEHCRKLIVLAPERESIYRQQMLYHFLSTDQNESLKAYQACVKALHDHLSAKPSPETQKLYEQIVQGHVEGIDELYSKPPVAVPRRHNLLLPLTSFIGRKKERAEVKRLLSSSRLITLTGVGGCGKTRLALQVASEIVDEFTDGVWCIELAALSDPTLVPQAVATVLEVREEAGRSMVVTLTDHLRLQQLVLVLDNCEHLIQACAQLAETLLRECPTLKILASSREALGIAGEIAWRVPSLSLPNLQPWPPLEDLTQQEAIQLFCERATVHEPSFMVTDQNALAVAQICRRLDGIPLAIELAAARIKVLTAEQIAARLDDSFRLLTGGSRTALPRQQTLRAAIDWSYELLTEKERVLLRRLSVFVGGWTLDAAEYVCSAEGIKKFEVLDLLTHSVDKSLVLVQGQNGESRYKMLETVRQYAREKLRESADVEIARDHHRDWFLALAECADPELKGPNQSVWAERLEVEHNNLRAALEWSLTAKDGAEPGLRLAGALSGFWHWRDHASEGCQWLERVLQRGDRTSPALRVKALYKLGWMSWYLGNLRSGLALLEKAISLAREVGMKEDLAIALLYLGHAQQYENNWGQSTTRLTESLRLFRELSDEWGMARVLTRLGLGEWWQGHYRQATTLLEESLTIFQKLKDKRSMALSLNILGLVFYSQGDLHRATALFEESLALFQELGETGSVVLSNLGSLANIQGDYERASKLLEKSIALYRKEGSKLGIAMALPHLGNLAVNLDDLHRALALFKEGLVVSNEISYKPGIISGIKGIATVASRHGNIIRAARLLGAAEALREAIGIVIVPDERIMGEQTLAIGRSALGEETFAKAWAQGLAMTLEQAIAYALEQ